LCANRQTVTQKGKSFILIKLELQMYENQVPLPNRQNGNPLEDSKLLAPAFKNIIEVFKYLSNEEIHMHEVSLLEALNDRYEIVATNCRDSKE